MYHLKGGIRYNLEWLANGDLNLTNVFGACILAIEDLPFGSISPSMFKVFFIN
jgi:hypothetical protein